MDFQGKTVVITGGASGMGLLAGECFAKEGANVILADLNQETLHAAVDKVKEYTDCVIGIQTNVTDYEQISRMCEEAVNKFGKIDILIPFAGGAETRLLQTKGDFLDHAIDVFDFGIDLNLKGAVYAAHAAMNHMKKQDGGVVILLGSITGEEGSDSSVAYSAAKSALMNGVVKSLAMCGAKYGIRVCTVAPGPVLTRPGMAAMKTIMGRAADPQEIVDMILYLASDKAKFVTGTSFLIDGGRNIMLNKDWD